MRESLLVKVRNINLLQRDLKNIVQILKLVEHLNLILIMY